jgi:hypothetical protein
VIEEAYTQHLFDVLCSNKGERDFDNVEISNPDDNRGSVVSSTMDSVASCDNNSPLQDDINNIANADAYNNPDWENLNKPKLESNIANTLKKLENSKKKKPTSPLIPKDMLGADTEALINPIMENHVEPKHADCRIINDIYCLVKYVGQLFEKCRKRLHRSINQSK